MITIPLMTSTGEQEHGDRCWYCWGAIVAAPIRRRKHVYCSERCASGDFTVAAEEQPAEPVEHPSLF